MKFVLFSVLIATVATLAKGNLSGASDKIAQVITKAAKDDRKNDLQNSMYMKPAMDQLNREFINPYNSTYNNLGLEDTVTKELKNGLTTCDATRKTSYSIQERSDYFSNQLYSIESRHKTNCPVSTPLVQREHEVVLGFLLNRLRMHALRAKNCPESNEDKDRVARGLKKVAENRFGHLGEEIKSCKRTNVAIGGSCFETGVLKAGPNEVITGLRLKKDTRSITPEIQVAKVTTFGLIDKSTQKWVGPKTNSKSSCQPLKGLLATKPVKLPQNQGNVLTQLQLVGKTKKNLKVSGQKMNFWTGKLEGKPSKSRIADVVQLKQAKSIDTEPVYVSTTVAGAGLRFDVETKTVYPVLIAQNLATL